MKIETWVAEQLKDGKDPNDIEHIFSRALKARAHGWVKWGDGRWRLDLVCSVCGSSYRGLCEHPNTAILRSEWEAKHG